jgi:hypothetical protein
MREEGRNDSTNSHPDLPLPERESTPDGSPERPAPFESKPLRELSRAEELIQAPYEGERGEVY